MQKPKADSKSGQISTKSNAAIKKMKLEYNQDKSDSGLGQTHTKSQNYKKLILQNNAKILEF